MASFDRIKPGDRLWDCHRTRMGNTTRSRMGCWDVRVIEIDAERRRALVSWNGNAPTWYAERQIARLRRSPIKTKSP